MSCSRTQHGDGRSRTPDLSLRSPTLYHWATALPLSMSNDKFSHTLMINGTTFNSNMGRVKRIWYLSPMRAAKVQASLRICAVSPEPPLLAHTSSESRGTFRQKARSLAPLNGWACAVKIWHDRMLKDTNSLDAVPIVNFPFLNGDVPQQTSYGVYISQLIRFTRAFSQLSDFNCCNKATPDRRQS